MLRPATPADAPQICRLIRALAEYERRPEAVVFDDDEVREHLFGSRPFAEVLLAEEAGRVIGFALYFHTYSTFIGKPGLYLEDLFVEPDFRRQGIGRALFAAVARIAVNRDCGRLEWSVLDWNEPAIEFYRSLGAKAKGEWTAYCLSGSALERAAVP